MKPITLAFLVVFSSLSVRPAGAQQTAAAPTPRPVPPEGPLLKSTADFSAWTIIQRNVPGLGSAPAGTLVGAAAASGPPDSVSVVTKTGPVRHQLTKLKTGEQTDVWYEHGNRVRMQSVWKTPMFEAASSPTDPPVGPDFPGLGWISASNFTGMQMQQGARCLVFESTAPDGDPRLMQAYGLKPTTKLVRAFINADTRLPWLVQSGNTVQVYTFRAAPNTVLEVPAEYQAMFDSFEKSKATARRPVGS